MGNQRRNGGGNRRPRHNNQQRPQQPNSTPRPNSPIPTKPKVIVPKAPPESTLVIGKKVKTGAKHAAVTLSMLGGYAAYRHYKDRDNLH